MRGHFGEFVRWTKARRGLTNVRFAEMIGVSDRTVGNIFTYALHDRLDDVALSKMAYALGFRNEVELIEAYQHGVPDFEKKPAKSGPKVDLDLIDENRNPIGSPAKSPGRGERGKRAKKP